MLTTSGHRPRGVLLALLTAAVLSTLLPVLAAGTAQAAPANGHRFLGAPTSDAGAAEAGPRSTPSANRPQLTLRRADDTAATALPPGAAPDGEGGGYSCTPYVEFDFSALGEDNFLEETVTTDYYGEVACNFTLAELWAAGGILDRSEPFNGQTFDDTVISRGSQFYDTWTDFGSSFGGLTSYASTYNGARRVEPGFEMILVAPEGFIWDACEFLPGLRYLACDGLGTNELYVLLGVYPQSTGLTKPCRILQDPVTDPEQARVNRTLISGQPPVSTQLLRLIPSIKNRVVQFKKDLCAVTTASGASTLASNAGQLLWDTATTEARNSPPSGDDRQLYWARLSMTKAWHQWVAVAGADKTALQAALDRASRGMNSHSFSGGGPRVFVSGFDPFLLDETTNSILRGNPSAAAVLRLDGTFLGGAEVQAVVFPVRFDDFDAGLVEQVFTTHLTPGGQQASIITTVSQGGWQNQFDLEFYNGRRRATDTLDNRNRQGGGSPDAPHVPANMAPGEEFVQTTLPVDPMVTGSPFSVQVNTQIQELTTQPPRPACQTQGGIRQLCDDGPTLGSTAVDGGGSSFLSNEIAYRVTRLRDQLGVNVPSGHVHTPYLAPPSGISDTTWSTKRGQIATQYQQILQAAVNAPAVPPIALTANSQVFQVGQSPVYTVTGPPNRSVEWSGVHNGTVVERDLRPGHTTNGSGTWSGSYHQWQPNQVGQWVRWARVHGRLAKVSLTVNPAPTLPPAVSSDFDGDNLTDVAVWRPSDGVWYAQPSTGGYTTFQFGLQGDLPVDADFSGDGRNDYAVFRPSDGNWHVHTGTSYSVVQWGLAGDIPVPYDYDRDGRADIAVWRPSDGVWYVLPSSGSGWYGVQFGQLDDRPAPGDYDGDGVADLAVFRPGTATWHVRRSSDGQTVATQFGLLKDKLVPADYDGDGRTDLAVFRPTDGSWRVLQSSDGALRTLILGGRISIPTPGDYDGDGRADFAVFSSGSWQIRYNTGGTHYVTFGVLEDAPVPGVNRTH